MSWSSGLHSRAQALRSPRAGPTAQPDMAGTAGKLDHVV